MDFEARVRRELQIILGFEESSLNMNQKIKEFHTSGLSAEDIAILAAAKPSGNDAVIYQTSTSQPPAPILSLKDDSQAQTDQSLSPLKFSSQTPTSAYSSNPIIGAPSSTKSDIAIGAGGLALPSQSAKSYQIAGSHYRNYKIQPVEYIVANGLSFLAGNVIKYVTRYKEKNGAEDIRKAIHYLNLILEFEYKE